MNTEARLRLCRLDEVEPDGMKKIAVPGRRDPLCVYRTAEGVFVTDDTCTHGLASLSEGFLENGRVHCPYHGGAFDIKTGAAVSFPCTDPVRAYRCWVANGEILIAAPAAA